MLHHSDSYQNIISNVHVVLYKQIITNSHHSKMPERESDHLTPATRLLEKRREMTEVELALATQKEVRTSIREINNSVSQIKLIYLLS